MKRLLLALFIISTFNSKGTIHTIGVWGGYYEFVPASITIQLGDTVEWTPYFGLLPMMLHTITSDNIPVGAVSFDQVWQMPADTFFQYIPQVAGLYQYVCTPHIPNGMIGEFIVTNGSATQTYVPDDDFEQELINLGYDTVLDDSVLTVNISYVTSLMLSNLNISDLTGIEAFTSLTFLSCQNNQLSSLDVTQNTQLTSLNVILNSITNLDLSNNTLLGALFCGENLLTSIDVSNNTSLTFLSCYENQITSLDITQNTALTDLSCQYNQITNLDVTQNTALTNLTCGINQITNLDVTQNTALTNLFCGQNPISSLDVSQNIALTHLNCASNQLTNLDVSQNTSLIYLSCVTNQLDSIDVSSLTSLEKFFCYSNQLTFLDLRNGNNTNFISLDLTNNPNLSCINVDNATWSDATWSVANGDIDVQHYFSNNCFGTSEIEEYYTNKEFLKITDLLGREIKAIKNTSLFYIYDDGTVEKIIIIE